MKRFFQFLLGLILIMFVGGVYLAVSGSFFTLMQEPEKKLTGDTILVLRVNGVILNSERVLKQIKKYAYDDKVKAVVVRINSPGGVVGSSQEYYNELKRLRLKTKKPVVVSCADLAASGAYYTAVAGDKIFVNAGTLMGSIGVIMEFANLSGLYDWAKIKRYVIKTGAYKDSGAEYRPMRDDEQKYFQTLIDEVHMQFKKAVAEGRHLPLEKVEPYADGRVFNGETAVKLGFADEIGTFQDAIDYATTAGNIKGKPDIFEPPKWRENFLQLFMEQDEDQYEGKAFGKIFKSVFKPDLLGRPLFLMPGVLEGSAQW